MSPNLTPPADAAASLSVETATSTVPRPSPTTTTNMEQMTGYLAASYPCAYEGVHGTLYAGRLGLYFEGHSTFFWAYSDNKTIFLPWEQVRQVQKLSHGIAILMRRSKLTRSEDDTVVHSFVSMTPAATAPERAWVILVSLHNEALLDYPSGSGNILHNSMSRHGRPSLLSPDWQHQQASLRHGRRRLGSRSAGAPGGTLKRRNSDSAAQLAFWDALQDDTEEVSGERSTPRGEDNEEKEVSERNLSDTRTKPADSTTTITTPKGDEPEKSSSPKESTTTRPSPVLDWFNDMKDPTLAEITTTVGGRLAMEGLKCTYTTDITYQGKLFAGPAGLYFTGKRLLWETKRIFIAFPLIRQFHIQRPKDEKVADNDLDDLRKSKKKAKKKKKKRRSGIAITTKEKEVFKFDALENADKLWACLIALQNENLAIQGQSLNRRHSLQRMNSDPMIPCRSSWDADFSESEEDGSVPESLHSFEAPNLANEWASALARQKDYSHTVVRNQTLRCTMDRFHELFVADDATYNVADFLQGRGDTELQVSNWQVSPEDDKKQCRVIEYNHPVNAPLAPPMAGARKEQNFQRYGEHGLCLETKTIVADVPMADCFYVADCIRVAPNGADKVTVTMDFDIRFIKSTMFKSIIGKTTKAEFTDLFESLFKYFKENLGEVPTLPTTSEQKTEGVALPSVQPSPNPMVVPALLCLIIAFQLYNMLEMRKLSAALQSLQNATAQQCSPLDMEDGTVLLQ